MPVAPVTPFASHVELEPEEAEVETPAFVVEPVEMPAVEMPVYPVGSGQPVGSGSTYYETARQQARQEVVPPRIEFAVPVAPVDEAGFAEDEAEEGSAAGAEAAAGPMIVEHALVEDAPAQVAEAAVVREAMPELVPVRASVFDDDFFRRPREEAASKPVETEVKRWPESRVPTFGGYAVESTPTQQVADEAEDELDIPAFLRRKS
jgi:cell division protein FtsZ